MSFWASSYSFQLETLFAACCSLFKVVLLRVCFYDTIVRKPARCFPGLLVSIDYI